MPRKKYSPRPGSRPIGDARRYSVRSTRRGHIDHRKYVAALARFAIAQAEAEAQAETETVRLQGERDGQQVEREDETDAS